MRRCGSASMGETGFFEDEGVLLGVYLAADYAAEHEWGINNLCALFGISGEGVGVEKRAATVVPTLQYEEKGNEAVLVVTQYKYRLNGAGKSEELRIYKGKFAGAWSDGDFGIHVEGEDNVAKLRKLHEAIQNKNVLLYIGGNGGNPFSNGGLVVAIRDVYPAEWAENMCRVDEDRIALEEAAKATGIRERICANLKSSFGGKPFYALSPRWRNERDNSPSAHKVIFWLNPCDQDKLNWGWFTVEELDQWIEGKGPVIKS